MKTLRILFGFILMAAVMSCSSDDSVKFEYNKNNLTGTYSLKQLESKHVKTVKVDGFDVVTTTTLTGDTFNTTYSFSSDNSLTKNGTYRIVEARTQNNQTRDTTYIVVLDNEQVNYSVQETEKLLTIEGVSYNVLNFNETGFRLKRNETRVEGEATIEFQEELRFEK